MKRFLGICFLAVLIGLFLPQTAYAKTRKMTAYDQIIKDGNTVYCSTWVGIYRINLKSKKAKRIVKNNNPEDDDMISMKKRGKYLYYIYAGGGGMTLELFRVKCTGGKPKRIAGNSDKDIGVDRYAISGSKIYWKICHPISGSLKGSYKMVMKTNGEGKKKTAVNVKMKTKRSNKKRYRIIVNKGRIYLKTSKKIYLAKHPF